MIRFFVDPDQIADGEVTLNEDDAHHVRVVLQMSPGGRISVLDGSGTEWEATLLTVGKRSATAALKSSSRPQTEPHTRIMIAQALPKMAEKMEQVLQRGTEIGAHGFRAFSSTRSLTHLTGERQEKRLARWKSIIKTAAEQSHRALLPEAFAVDTFETILASASEYDLAILAYEDERERSLKAALRREPGPRSILLVVGPESGITPQEADAARAAGLISVSLGPRILRTETAAMAAAAQILYELEG